jgi:hypothetical protein
LGVIDIKMRDVSRTQQVEASVTIHNDAEPAICCWRIDDSVQLISTGLMTIHTAIAPVQDIGYPGLGADISGFPDCGSVNGDRMPLCVPWPPPVT